MGAQSHYRGPTMNAARLPGEQLATRRLTSAALRPSRRLCPLRTSYHSNVDATDAALIGGVFGVLIGAGAMLAFRLTEREQQGDPEPESALLPPGATAVLAALRSGSVVVDSSEAIVWASPAAYAWGLVRDGSLTDEEVVRAVRAVRSEGDLRTLDLEPRRRRRGGPRMIMTVRVAPLSDSRQGLPQRPVGSRDEASGDS